MPRSLLYIDDDHGLCRLVTRALEREGIKVTCANDGESGLKMLSEDEFDVIALDQNMPGLDGLGTLERIHALPDHPPVIFVTAAQDSKLAVNALKAGAFDYVVKDAGGEFVPLLKAAAQTAVKGMRMLRAKEAAEAEVREARDRFQALADERAMLLREVNHRVGNSLQLIASLLHMQGNTSSSEDVKDALNAATGRVMAVAQVHRRLYTSDTVKSVAVDQYLKALVEDLRISAESDGLAQLTISADPIETDPDRAVAVGVIVNELIMNALKYAYPADKGPIRVGLKANGPDSAVVIVEDDGVGMDASMATPQRGSTGLGQRIVRAMADKLGAKVDHDAKHRGTKIEIAFALSRPRPPLPLSP
jgi:two-component sensor histidine kinase/ActR/RegA family two-component response regulator